MVIGGPLVNDFTQDVGKDCVRCLNCSIKGRYFQIVTVVCNLASSENKPTLILHKLDDILTKFELLVVATVVADLAGDCRQHVPALPSRLPIRPIITFLFANEREK